MDENNGVIICPKCGNEMHYKDRFCFHCGYINYDNNNNDFLVKYDKKAQKIIKRENRKKKEHESKFFTTNLKEETKKEKKKFYRSMDEYREEVQHAEMTDSERKATMRNRITRAVVLILFIVVVVYGYKLITTSQQKYIDQSKEIVNAIKNKYGNNNFSKCTKGDEYLFEFNSNSLKNDYNLDIVSPYLGNSFTGYVLVTKENGKYIYKISLSDGTFGIREKNVDELKKLDVLPYYKVNIPSISTSCR